jgi:hypothetical protein
VAYDALLKLTGPANASSPTAPGDPIEGAPIAATGDGGAGYKYVGKYRTGYLECRIGGAFDRADGNETIQFTVWEATNLAGAGAAQIASGAVLAAGNRANYGSAAADGKTPPAHSDGPTRVGFTTGAGGYIKARFVAAGTTPSAASVSADVVMTSVPVLSSGR